MKKTISLNMKFWHDGQEDSTRTRNVIYCWNDLKKLNTFINNHSMNFNSSCYLFDFSPEKIIEDAIHIPYPIGEYKKAEKTNIILKQYVNHLDYFMMFDSDTFFDFQDYDNLIKIIDNLEKNDIITFDAAKLDDINNCFIDGVFDRTKANWSYAYSGSRENGPLNGYRGGLGGVYIIDTSILLNLGGFDEKYIGWGGEDGEMMNRIYNSGFLNNIKPQKNIAPFHMPHFCDYGNDKYYQRFKDE